MIVLGISGKKKSGKSTLAKDIARFSADLWPTYDGDGMRTVRRVEMAPFAGPIKWMCTDLLGMSSDIVYGDDDAKNSLTGIRWGAMPHYLKLKAELGDSCPPEDQLMRSRDVQQHLGTEIFRAMHEHSFTTAYLVKLRYLSSCYPDSVVITDDLRFPNELEVVRGAGGFTIRLLRGEAGDGHASETSLTDRDGRFDFILDNRNLSKFMTFGAVVQQFVKEGMVLQVDADVALRRAEHFYNGK